MPLVRTFIAVEVPPEVREGALKLIQRLKGAGAKVTWVGAGQMHWTLKFLGDVDLTDVAEICEAVRKAVEPLASFDIETCGLGAFPNVERPRTIWLGTGRGSEAMVELQEAIELALADLGYRPEGRRFRPHLTIGRVRGSEKLAELGQLLAEEKDFAGCISAVCEVLVLSSELTPKGPIYETLGHAELKG